MDSYWMMVKVHREELLREAGQDRRAAVARRAARTRQAVPGAVRGLVVWPARRLAMAVARLRPTAAGR
ncbi:MAG TPA: hypothetical protein VMV92_09090 [Streptosporangiaceae bacterium]|nr:hypothetical protein [Streptosporangiaceae bacterium]HVB43252.1 hypothetical protein [Streptosporangiaceae bacterium]